MDRLHRVNCWHSSSLFVFNRFVLVELFAVYWQHWLHIPHHMFRATAHCIAVESAVSAHAIRAAVFPCHTDTTRSSTASLKCSDSSWLISGSQ